VSYKICEIKNIDTVDNTYQSKLLTPNEEYLIPDVDRIQWSNDSDILNDICDDKVQIGDGENWLTDYNDQINWLKDVSQADGASIILFIKDKNSSNYGTPTHDSDKNTNVHIRRDYDSIKTNEYTSTGTNDLWVPTTDYHLDVQLIEIAILNKIASKSVEVKVELNTGTVATPVWKILAKAYKYGEGESHIVCDYSNCHIDGGYDGKLRIIIEGDSTDFKVFCIACAHEED